jgi:hypothetical protein
MSMKTPEYMLDPGWRYLRQPEDEKLKASPMME